MSKLDADYMFAECKKRARQLMPDVTMLELRISMILNMAEMAKGAIGHRRMTEREWLERGAVILLLLARLDEFSDDEFSGIDEGVTHAVKLFSTSPNWPDAVDFDAMFTTAMTMKIKREGADFTIDRNWRKSDA